jgi:nucleoside-diphosphate-sugar epimerase
MGKTLITGANGFLGQFFYNSKKLSNENIIFCSTSTSEFGVKVASEYSSLESSVAGEEINSIIHLASVIPSDFKLSNYDLFEKNTRMMENLMSFSLKNNVKRFVYLSSFGSMNRPSSYDVKDHYTLSKIVGEHYCSMMSSKGISSISLRLSSPFGEFSFRKNVISIFTEQAINQKPINVFGSGQRKQNFIYAEDIVDCVKNCLKTTTEGVYSLIGSETVSMLSLAHLVKEIAESKSEIVIGNQIDPLEKSTPPFYNETSSVSQLGFVPSYSLEQGLKRYIDWKKNENSNSV